MFRVVSLYVDVTAIFTMNSFAKPTEKVKVAITRIMLHRAADIVRKGVGDVIEENGYKMVKISSAFFISTEQYFYSNAGCT
ncbi:hypothetical protein V3564_06130 [Bartonella sp. B12(2025)]